MSHQAPLPERVRPQRLEDFIGQAHLLGPEGALRPMLQQSWLPSLLLWGPPGVGKTTLVRILAQELERPLLTLSAVQAGVKEVRSALEQARFEPGLLLFIDEIHRFNKSQQDALLHAVEQGTVTFIGATTENPSFEVIPALRSRCQLFLLHALGREEIEAMIRRALSEDAVLRSYQVEQLDTEALYRLSGGDGRKALHLLEMALSGQPPGESVRITDKRIAETAQTHLALYDRDGEQHYDIISAFIKSVRGSDPNAALYWLARMLEGGEDIRFIARRLIILASEDIGNANPNALLLATSCFQAIDVIGMPEARIVLAQTTTYLASCPKSNAAYTGIDMALARVRQGENPPVPLHLRNAVTGLMKQLDYGKGYRYSHDYPHEGREGNQEYLPSELSGTTFYYPREIGRETELARFLRQKWGDHYDY